MRGRSAEPDFPRAVFFCVCSNQAARQDSCHRQSHHSLQTPHSSLLMSENDDIQSKVRVWNGEYVLALMAIKRGRT